MTNLRKDHLLNVHKWIVNKANFDMTFNIFFNLIAVNFVIFVA